MDERADLFAVGAVLYEALAGRPTFPGRTAQERIHSILHHQPEPIDRPDVTSQMNAMLLRALAKEPSQRFATASDFLVELRRSTGLEQRVTSEHRLAILDFHNLSQDERTAWVEMAAPEEIRNRLDPHANRRSAT